ncbi:bifunctional metallophosphatase/5'-nucleotidase [Scleromatobacter humisilvae]|uniref:Bifunctional metallophosphatase/5'-nucleotidase n=1 Tax=Scleromatobacter humisilvae TaxID=2897159 RepID=A0A9X1YLX3_9BURK|nr:bifunctional metallophosphatase/5'-nucleotidase [Scleromatobacter humisilvae]MCK9687870.1 bifunctional metallophosphatase/5'-nucleotidase [Scleromatobacter humisilvae]
MKTSFLPLAAALLATTLAGCATPPPPAPLTVKIVAFNDFHGNLQSPGKLGTSTQASQRPAVGGADALAAYVARLKAQNPRNVVVAGGDLVGASPLVSALFFDEPTVEVLNHVGVDFTSVGNHEFDKGADALKRLQHGGCKLTQGMPDPNSCKGLGSAAPGTFDGAHFQWLAANVVETATGRTLLPAYGIKSFDGIPVAFIGMTLRGTPGIVSPTGVAGLEFRDEADTVNALVPQLRAQGVGAIVVLVHQGGTQPASGASDINGCDAALHGADGRESDIGEIVRRLDDAVDLVISAHTHAAYNCSANAVGSARATGLPNRTGRLVPVTSANAFGRVLTDIDVTLDPKTHRVLAVSPTNRLVDRGDPDIVKAIDMSPAVRDIVQGYATLAAPLADGVVGRLATALPAIANDAGEEPAGSLIADTQLRATQPPALGGAQIAFMNNDGVRSPGFVPPAGATAPFALTYGAAFTVQPFGNSLVTMTLTSAQLKALLEQQFTGCGGQVVDRPLQPSNGLRVAWSAGAPACAKIVDVTFTPTDVTATPPVATGPAVAIVKDGVVLEPARAWRVTVNNFLAAGGDSFSTLTAGTGRLGGAQDIDALRAYMASTLAPDAPYDPSLPALGEPRIVRKP